MILSRVNIHSKWQTLLVGTWKDARRYLVWEIEGNAAKLFMLTFLYRSTCSFDVSYLQCWWEWEAHRGWLAFALTACKLCSEMEFSDIILTKESFAPDYSQSLLLADFNERHTQLWFLKSFQTNPRNKKTRVYLWIGFCRTEKWG